MQFAPALVIFTAGWSLQEAGALHMATLPDMLAPGPPPGGTGRMNDDTEEWQESLGG